MKREIWSGLFGMVALGAAIDPATVDGFSAYGGYHAYGHEHVTPFDPEALKYVAQEMVLQAGAQHKLHRFFLDSLVEDGKISAIGPATRVRIPADAVVLEAEVVTPGLVDVHTVVGLAGIYNSDQGQVQDQDQLEKSDPVQPELRARILGQGQVAVVERIKGSSQDTQTPSNFWFYSKND